MSKRILSILLVLLLCVGILPLGAMAAEEDEIVPAEEEILNEEIENGNEETIEETPEEIEPEPDDAEPLAAGNINQILTSKGVVLSGSTVYNGESVRHHLIDVYVMAKNYSSYQTNTGDRLLEYRLNDAWETPDYLYYTGSTLCVTNTAENEDLYWYEITHTANIDFNYPDSPDKTAVRISYMPSGCYHMSSSSRGCWGGQWYHHVVFGRRSSLVSWAKVNESAGNYADVLKSSETVLEGDKIGRTIEIYVNGKKLFTETGESFPNRPDDKNGNRYLQASDIKVTPKSGYEIDMAMGSGTGIEVVNSGNNDGAGTYRIYLKMPVNFDLNSPSEDLLFENSAELSTKMPEVTGTAVYLNGIGKISQHYAPASQKAEDNEIGYDEPLWVFNQKSGSYTKLYLKGWNTKPDGSGELYKPGDKPWFETATTLYAIWGAPYEVRYYYDFNLVEVQTEEALIGTEIIIQDGDGYGHLDYLKIQGYDHGYQDKIETVKADGSTYVNIIYARLYEIYYKVSPDCAGMGTVSVDVEAVQGVAGIADKAAGSTAIPAETYKFSKWVNESGVTVSEDAFFAPETPENGWSKSSTYFAFFEPCSVNYIVDMPDGYSHSFDKPKIGTVTLNIAGAGNTKDVAADGLANLIQKTLLPDKETHKYVAGEVDASKGDLLYAFKNDALSLFRFDGWETKTGERYAIGDKPEFTEDTTLYAVWSYVGKASMKDNEKDDPADKPKNDPEKPNTGDETVMPFMLTVALASLTGALTILVRGKKRKDNKN